MFYVHIDNFYTPPHLPPPPSPLLFLLHFCVYSEFKVILTQIGHKSNKFFVFLLFFSFALKEFGIRHPGRKYRFPLQQG